MGERKIGDAVIGIIWFLFFLGGFSFIITDFDSQFTNDEGYGDSLNTLYLNASTDYKDSDTQLQQNLLNGSSFTVTAGSDIDTRGSSQVAVMSKNSPGTIMNFLNLAGQYMAMHKIITTTLVFLIIVTITILWLRVLRPGGI